MNQKIKLPDKNDLAWMQFVRPTLMALLKNEKISDREIIIYLILRCVADYKTGKIEASVSELAEIFLMNEQKIARGLKILELTGFIRANKQKGCVSGYICVDMAVVCPDKSEHEQQVSWDFIPAEFGKIRKLLKCWVDGGEQPTTQLIQINQINNLDNMNVQINVSASLTSIEIAEMRALHVKGLLPRFLLKTYPQVIFD